jgi:adenosylcobinamide kinase/adenosylcobinamide-phosphate guanylyltransferase
VPQSAVARWFEDEAGRLNQAVAARCDRVVLMVAGIPLTVKG